MPRYGNSKKNLLCLGIGSKNDSVQTPVELYEKLNEIYSFDFDPCPLVRPLWDGLKIDWGQTNFVNPPFSQINKWLSKVVQEFEKGRRSVVLVTLRPNCRYWNKFVWPFATDIQFFNDSVKFVGYERGFPHPLCLIDYDPKGSPMQTSVTVVSKNLSFRSFVQNLNPL